MTSRCPPNTGPPIAKPHARALTGVASVRMVTVQYKTGVGSRVTVCWLDDTPGPPSINDRSARGQTVLLVRSTSGTAVVAGDAPEPILRSTAARLQAARGAAIPAAVSYWRELGPLCGVVHMGHGPEAKLDVRRSAREQMGLLGRSDVLGVDVCTGVGLSRAADGRLSGESPASDWAIDFGH